MPMKMSFSRTSFFRDTGDDNTRSKSLGAQMKPTRLVVKPRRLTTRQRSVAGIGGAGTQPPIRMGCASLLFRRNPEHLPAHSACKTNFGQQTRFISELGFDSLPQQQLLGQCGRWASGQDQAAMRRETSYFIVTSRQWPLSLVVCGHPTLCRRSTRRHYNGKNSCKPGFQRYPLSSHFSKVA